MSKQPKAQAGDFIRFEGALHKVVAVLDDGDYEVQGPNAVFIGDDEIKDSDVLLESEGYDEFYGAK